MSRLNRSDSAASFAISVWPSDPGIKRRTESGLKSGFAIGAAVIGLSIAFGIGLLSIDGTGGYSGLSPGFMPTLVALGLALCGLMILVQTARGRFVAGDDELEATGDTAPLSPTAGTDLIWLIAGLVLHMVLIGWVGFIAASTLLMVFVARGYGSRQPLRDAIVALAVTVPIWALFSQVIGISLPLLPLLKS
jgi:putative tricarboxylic transport membrane protein